MRSLSALCVAAALSVALAGCSINTSEATSILEAQGYTNVQITGYDWFGCGQDDNYHTGFQAVGQNGAHVQGVICGALFKGQTVRITGTW